MSPASRTGIGGILLALLFSGCGTTLVWTGKTPDRRHSLRIEEDGRDWYLSVNGDRVGPFDSILKEGLAFGETGLDLAYPVRIEDEWFVVRNNTKHGPWLGIGFVWIDPSSGALIYSARDQEGWRIAQERYVGPAFDLIYRSTVQTDLNGDHLAYAGELGAVAYVVHDEFVTKLQKPFSKLVLSDSGERLAIITGEYGDQSVSVGDVEIGPFQQVQGCVFSPTSQRMAFVGIIDRSAEVVLDGSRVLSFDSIRGIRFTSKNEELIALGVRDSVDVLVIGSDTTLTSTHPIDFDQLIISRGTLHAFVAESDGVFHVVSEAVRPVAYTAITDIVATEDGESVAYVGVRDDSSRVVRNQQEGPWYSGISDLMISKDGSAVSYVAEVTDSMYVHVDDQRYGFDVVVSGSLVNSEDWKNWVAVVGDRSDHSLRFMLNGTQVLAEFNWNELASEISSSPDEVFSNTFSQNLLRSWSRAELNLALENQRK